MGAIASQITSLTIVYLTVYSDADQRKHQSSASLAFVWPVTRKMFPFDDVIMVGEPRHDIGRRFHGPWHKLLAVHGTNHAATQMFTGILTWHFLFWSSIQNHLTHNLSLLQLSYLDPFSFQPQTSKTGCFFQIVFLYLGFNQALRCFLIQTSLHKNSLRYLRTLTSFWNEVILFHFFYTSEFVPIPVGVRMVITAIAAPLVEVEGLRLCTVTMRRHVSAKRGWPPMAARDPITWHVPATAFVIALDPCLIFVRRRNGGRQRNQPIFVITMVWRGLIPASVVDRGSSADAVKQVNPGNSHMSYPTRPRSMECRPMYMFRLGWQTVAFQYFHDDEKNCA